MDKYIVVFTCEPNIENFYGIYDSIEKAREDVFKSCSEFHNSKVSSIVTMTGKEIFTVKNKYDSVLCNYKIVRVEPMTFNSFVPTCITYKEILSK